MCIRDRQRGVEVGEGFERHRNAVIARLGEPVEIGFSHGELHGSSYCKDRGAGLSAPAQWKSGAQNGAGEPGPPGPGLRPEGVFPCHMQVVVEHGQAVFLEVSQGLCMPDIPVSYTHLDVYKRQVQAVAEGEEGVAGHRRSGQREAGVVGLDAGDVVLDGAIGQRAQGLDLGCLLYTSRCV